MPNGGALRNGVQWEHVERPGRIAMIDPTDPPCAKVLAQVPNDEDRPGDGPKPGREPPDDPPPGDHGPDPDEPLVAGS